VTTTTARDRPRFKKFLYNWDDPTPGNPRRHKGSGRRGPEKVYLPKGPRIEANAFERGGGFLE
jgi:hypothetical protein